MALSDLRMASIILEAVVKLESRFLLTSTYFGVNQEFLLDLFLAVRREEEILATYYEPKLGITLLLGERDGREFFREKEIICI